MSKGYRNYMEDVVERAALEYLRQRKEVCRCQGCFRDMVAAALNQLPPHYATREEGLTTLVEAQKQVGFVSQVLRALNSAAERVQGRPRHAGVMMDVDGAATSGRRVEAGAARRRTQQLQAEVNVRTGPPKSPRR